MGKYSQYDAAEKVIFTDATGVAAATRQTIDEIFDELEAIARACPEKPYIVACWRDARFSDAEVAEWYGKRTSALLKWVRGILRYGANDPITRSYIRAQAVKHRAEGTKSNLYESREEALAAVRDLMKAR